MDLVLFWYLKLQLCFRNNVEDEIHFLLHCPLYSEYRSKLFENTGINQMGWSDMDLLCVLISNYPRQVAKYLYFSFMLRQSVMFRK